MIPRHRRRDGADEEAVADLGQQVEDAVGRGRHPSQVAGVPHVSQLPEVDDRFRDATAAVPVEVLQIRGDDVLDLGQRM